VAVDPFALAVYPVTNAEYSAFLRKTGHATPIEWGRPRFDHPRAPVCGVSWDDAMAYVAWLSAQTRRPYCLPSEAQREYAARGGRVQQAYPWGNGPLPLEGFYARGLAGPLAGGPIVCGKGPAGPNDFGIYHLADNVHEWCSDYYDPHYYEHSPPRNPCQTVPSDRRAARGGSWRHDIKYSRCAARSSLAPQKRFADFGFRLALGQR
jgi:formylglycine-generating enzyme required for sulfatase activity